MLWQMREERREGFPVYARGAWLVAVRRRGLPVDA